MISWSLTLLIAVVVLLIPTAYAGLIGAPYAPTSIAVVRKAFKQLGINEEDTVIDLGAGDGKILIEAASRGAKVLGFELSPFLWVIAWTRCKLFNLRKGKTSPAPLIGRRQKWCWVKYGNFFKQDISKATVVFAFLMPRNMPRVKEFLSKQSIPNGQYFLAYAFPFKDVAPLSVIREEKCAPLYVYDLKSLTRSPTSD